MSTTKTKKIAKYEVLDVLGKGGMGIVYKATDPLIGRPVAIKTITGNLCDDPDFLRRFYREAQSTGKLHHQNIVTVHDMGDEDGTPFLVMEYLHGESLQAIINERRSLSLLDKLNYITQACCGLNYAHQQGVIHRDIKPANIMVLNDGTVKIVDFGIARTGNENVTRTGQVVGTIQYMSPEQINGGTVDCRSDIFSMGVVLYQLLTYSLPFNGKDTGSTLLKIVNDPAPPLNIALKVYPPELDAIVERALAKRCEDRYATAEDFAFDLAQVQDQLKRDLVSESLKTIEDLLGRSELNKAKEQVFQILKVDRQNRRANELLKQIQTLIQNQQRTQQVLQLRTDAEEAIVHKRFDRALECLDQAVNLDSQNAELRQLQKETREAKERVEKVQDALRRAESAHCAGELDVALQAVEEALHLDSDYAGAQALYSAVTREICERDRQAEVNALLMDAQRQISSRRFTTAIDALQKAEALDGNAPAVKELMALAASGREQELRRKEIEQLSAGIQEALNRDDIVGACAKAEEAVQHFPTDNTLLKLQAVAQRQKQAAEKRQFVEENVSRARKLLEKGSTEQALEILETACARFPAEPAFLSLIAVVRENLEQQRLEARKREYIQRAKDALRRKAYSEGIDILEAASAELNSPAEIDDLLQFLKHEAAEQDRRQVLDAAAQEVHRLVTNEQYEDAVAFLRAILQEVSDEELEILLADAHRRLSEFNRRVSDAVATGERLLRSGRIAEAGRYLEAHVASCGRATEFQALLERAHREQERMQAIGAAVQSAREALGRQDFAAAAAAIKQCRESFGDHSDLSQVVAQIDFERREYAEDVVSKAVADSRTLLLGHSYQAALETLDDVWGLVEFAHTEVRERYAMLREELDRALADAHSREEPAATTIPQTDIGATKQQVEWNVVPNRERDLQELTSLRDQTAQLTSWDALEAVSERARLIAKRHADDTQLDSLAMQVADNAESRALGLAAAAGAAPSTVPGVSEPGVSEPVVRQTKLEPVAELAIPAPTSVKPAPPKPLKSVDTTMAKAGLQHPLLRGRAVWIGGVVAATLLVIVVAGVAGLRHRAPARKPAALPAEGYVEVMVQPWATVKTLTSADGKTVKVEESTPVVIHVPAGDYTISLVGPHGEEQTDRISVTANQHRQYQHTFEVVDAAKIVSSY